MGLLDSVLGSVLNNNGRQDQAAGGLGGLIGMLASNPQLIQIVTGMLSNGSAQGGLGGLMAKFQQAGMGDVIQLLDRHRPEPARSPATSSASVLGVTRCPTSPPSSAFSPVRPPARWPGCCRAWSTT
jgi:hypothetical protein